MERQRQRHREAKRQQIWQPRQQCSLVLAAIDTAVALAGGETAGLAAKAAALANEAAQAVLDEAATGVMDGEAAALVAADTTASLTGEEHGQESQETAGLAVN